MWVVITLSILAVGALAIDRLWRPGGRADLGSVTERWLAEHRAHQPGEVR
jgi:hypothetical protein